MHWLFLMSSDWLFLLDSEWSIPPGSNIFGCNYSEKLDLFRVFGPYFSQKLFSTRPEKPKSRFNSKPKSHFLEIIPIISRYYVLVPPRITLLSTRKSTFRDEKKQASFPFHSGNPTTFSSIFNFQFSDSMTSASVSASKPLLPLFHSAIRSKPYKPSLFLTFPVVFRIEEGAWEGLGMGCMLG